MVSFEAAKAADVQKGTAATNAQFTVQNEPGTALPNTGGSGTHFYTILGSILILMGFMTMVIGLQADIIAANRKLLEDIQYRVRKMEADDSRTKIDDGKTDEQKSN